MRPIRALILDADGVVINGERSRVTLERDFNITPEMTRPFFHGEFRACLVGKADLKDSLSPHLLGWGWRGTVQEFLDYWFEVEHQLDDELLAEVDRLRALGIACYLATNQERYRTEYILHVMGLGSRFDGIFSSAFVGYLKDDRRFFEVLKAQLSPIQPAEMLFWDDGASNVAAAQQAGLRAALYTDLETFCDVTRAFQARLTRPKLSYGATTNADNLRR